MEHRIPSEILAEIFKHLLQEDLNYAVSLVCRRWYDVLQEFHLVKTIVNLRSPLYQKRCQMLSNDFRNYPTFRNKVKIIKIINEDDSDAIDDGVEELYPIVRLSPNLEDLIIHMYSLKLFSNVLTKIQVTERLLNPHSKSLELIFSSLACQSGGAPRIFTPVNTELVYMSSLVERNFSGLDTLVIISFGEARESKRFAFVDNALFCKNNYFLQTIKIVCPFGVMTKSCLDYIISGRLNNLRNLSLFITLVDRVDSGKHIVFTRGNNGIISDKLKDFCLSLLTNYDISLRGCYEEPFHSFNSWKNEGGSIIGRSDEERDRQKEDDVMKA